MGNEKIRGNYRGETGNKATASGINREGGMWNVTGND